MKAIALHYILSYRIKGDKPSTTDLTSRATIEFEEGLTEATIRQRTYKTLYLINGL